MRLRIIKRREYSMRTKSLTNERLRSPLSDAEMRLCVHERTRYNIRAPPHLRFKACVRQFTETTAYICSEKGTRGASTCRLASAPTQYRMDAWIRKRNDAPRDAA